MLRLKFALVARPWIWPASKWQYRSTKTRRIINTFCMHMNTDCIKLEAKYKMYRCLALLWRYSFFMLISWSKAVMSRYRRSLHTEVWKLQTLFERTVAWNAQILLPTSSKLLEILLFCDIIPKLVGLVRVKNRLKLSFFSSKTSKILQTPVHSKLISRDQTMHRGQIHKVEQCCFHVTHRC